MTGTTARAAACLYLAVFVAHAQQPQNRTDSGVPPLVSFSGGLRDATGKPLAGVQALTFSLYAGPDSRTPLWQETQNVEADEQGHYTVHLGAATASGMPLDLFHSGNSLWLGVQPQGAGAVEQTRVLLVSVPYALKAGDAETLGGRPASAYVTREAIASASPADSATSKGSTRDTISTTATIGGAGTANYIPLWTDGADIGNSLMYQSGTNLGIGTAAPSARLHLLSPSASSKGLIVTGAASQSANLQEWQNSAGTALSYVNATGGAFFPAAGIGNTAPQAGSTLLVRQNFGNPAAATVSGVNTGVTMTPTAATAASLIAESASSTISGATGTTGPVYGALFQSTSSVSAGGTTGTLFGGRFLATNAGTGATNSIYGGQFSTNNQGGGTASSQFAGYFSNSVSANSSVGNLYGAFIASPSISSGTVTNAYGLYLQNTTGATGKNYSLYSAGGTNYFAGSVGIGTSSPSALLHVFGPKAAANGSAPAALIVQGGQGGDGGNASAGAGGSISLIAGNGGNGGMITGGGGSITLQPGFGGTGGLTLAGPGALLLAPSGGNVGVGTSNPTFTLDVNGNARFSGPVTFSQGISTTGQLASSIAPGTPPLSVA
ncbi:MAG TPA: hypothetical protein VFA04_07700 [Bryobacteraceae bacterium]|nr:hypothetical protein [Bryobacteraceae bacterium]